MRRRALFARAVSKDGHQRRRCGASFETATRSKLRAASVRNSSWLSFHSQRVGPGRWGTQDDVSSLRRDLIGFMESVH
jgi:hypothetical protein